MGNSRSVVDNMFNYDVVVREFELQLRYYVHLWKVYTRSAM